ncbi:hypothetical protein Tco_0774101 [Tanacetum coccineum]|uniref:Uncharacterized protein n=1 Tax=Tanacetum coccineum TaxID=301880 RepID=A0ABQ4ZR02_9ASTR
MDSCKTAKEMWAHVERLMRGTIQNQVDRETRFTNEFDQFVSEPGESLVSVYNRFSQLMNDLERNNMKFPTVLVNIKFLNSLQLEWLKYVTQVHLAKQLTIDSFDYLFNYLLQFEKLVNASRAKNERRCNSTDDRMIFSLQMLHGWKNLEELRANIALMSKIQAADQNSDDERAMLESAFISELESHDEAAKQQRFAQKVQQQNMTLTSQIEMYNNYLKEFFEADEREKRVQKQAESQLYRDRDIIRDLEKQRDTLSQEVKHFKQKNEELQQSHIILKRKMSKNEDKYHDTILDLEEKLKKNVDLFLKIESFQRDIKEMKDAFEQNDVYLDEIDRQNDWNEMLHLVVKMTKEGIPRSFYRFLNSGLFKE